MNLSSSMRVLTLIRLTTVAIAGGYGCESLQYGWVYWLEARLGHPDALLGRGYIDSIPPLDVGVYLIAVLAALLVFLAVPRFRWGIRALSWSLLLLAALLLSKVCHCISDSDFSFAMQIVCVGRLSIFATPPLIIGLLLRYRFVEAELGATTKRDG